MKILNQLYSGAEKIYNSKINNDHAPETLFINDSEIIEKIKNKNTIIFEPSFHIKKIKKIQINQNPQPSFNKNMSSRRRLLFETFASFVIQGNYFWGQFYRLSLWTYK